MQGGNRYKLHAPHFHGSVDFKNTLHNILLYSIKLMNTTAFHEGRKSRNRRKNTFYDDYS